MTDPDAPKVHLAPVRSGIAELAASQPSPSAHGRRRVAERRVVTLDGYVVHVRDEDDGDLHVVIADDNGYTMIIEFPDPACMQGSRVLAQASAARRRLMHVLGHGPVKGDLKIRVTGVVFFDRYHCQSGVASNAVELHPVLAVKTLEGANAADAPVAGARLGGAPAAGRDNSDAFAQRSISHPPRGGCCKICSKGQPCGDSCISLTYACHKGAGCACLAE